MTIKATDPYQPIYDTVLMTITVDEVDEAPVFTVDGKTSHSRGRRTQAAAECGHCTYTFVAYDD